jgi:hypothetical protein
VISGYRGSTCAVIEISYACQYIVTEKMQVLNPANTLNSNAGSIAYFRVFFFLWGKPIHHQ